MTLGPGAAEKMRKAFKKQARYGEVPATDELVRILSLPRRVWEDDPDLEAFAAQATRYLKLPEGRQTLRPLQAIALRELHDMGGCYAPIPVGEGKTHVSFLAATVVEAERPLLIVPAKLRDKTVREFEAIAQHWKRHPGVQIASYEKLSREGGTELLQKYQPDFVILDESHRAKNPQAAITRKLSAYMRTFPETKMLAMTGTSTKRSIFDFAHILNWCLPNCFPLPHNKEEMEVWAAAVDEIKTFDNRMPANPGALRKLCNPMEDMKGRSGIRSAVRRRIQETPGVVACESQSVDASLNITLSLETGYGEGVRALAEQLHQGIAPNGDVLLLEGQEMHALQKKWMLMRTLTSGFWYQWDPKPPVEWLAKRSKWRKAVRRVLELHLSGLESEALVAKAAGAGKIDQLYKELYEEWRSVRGLHTWKTVPVWEDDAVIDRTAKWAKKHKGLIWVSEVALGERLEKDLGLPYFGAMGKDKLGRFVESMQSKHGSIVVSVQANSEGRNLQYQWWDNLVISPPPTGTVWEQMIGRTHRPGQTAEEVWFEVIIGCATEMECWAQACRDAEYAQEMEGLKKLTIATVDKTFSTPHPDGGLW